GQHCYEIFHLLYLGPCGRHGSKRRTAHQSLYQKLMSRILMKIISAMQGMPPMDKAEVDRFLESKLNVQLATIDGTGDPNIHPVWFHYDKDTGDLYVTTNKMSKKMHNIRSKP